MIARPASPSRDRRVADDIAHAEYYFDTGLLAPEGRGAIRTPLIAHGVKANRAVLEIIAKYPRRQRLTSRQVTVDELFAPSTLEQ